MHQFMMKINDSNSIHLNLLFKDGETKSLNIYLEYKQG